jgi:hypothetical protein
MNAWLRFGEGEALMNELLAKFNVIGFAAGNTGAQMGGFFRKEIKTLDDMKGLKMRIGGSIGGRVIQRVGVVPQQLAAGDHAPPACTASDAGPAAMHGCQQPRRGSAGIRLAMPRNKGTQMRIRPAWRISPATSPMRKVRMNIHPETPMAETATSAPAAAIPICQGESENNAPVPVGMQRRRLNA